MLAVALAFSWAATSTALAGGDPENQVEPKDAGITSNETDETEPKSSQGEDDSSGQSQSDDDTDPIAQDEGSQKQTDQSQPDEIAKAEEQAKPGFSIDVLIERLKKTKAIGVFTKLALKGDVEDIIDKTQLVKEENGAKLEAVRSEFQGLVLKTITLLDEDDPDLAKDIYQARDFVWVSILEIES